MSGCEFILQYLEALLTSIRPCKLNLLMCQFCHSRGNGRKPLNKPSIVTGQPQKALYISRGQRPWPILHGICLLRINLNSFAGHHMPEERNFLQPEFTFAEFCE